MARVRNLPKRLSSVYLSRARQHERQLDHAVENKRWDAAGVSAIHLVISSIDAVTCAKLGQVWAGEDHAGVADLLREVNAEGVENTLRQVLAILEAKTRVEYGAEASSAAGALDLAKRAKRVFEWAEATLAELGP